MTIDQSGRIEETNKDTIIGLADKKRSFTLKLTSSLKRKLQNEFRLKGKPKVFPIIVFANVVYLSVKKSHFWPDTLVIDIEYFGHEPAIKNIILSLYRKEKRKEPLIYFSNIGKKDPAHIISLATFRGKRKPDVNLNWKEILKLTKQKRPRAFSNA